LIFILDCEATSLGDKSFPIEIAWLDKDGQSELHLIRPADAWLDANSTPRDWDPESERAHGISFAMLLEQGTPFQDVARRVAEILGAPGAEIYSDAADLDGHWVGRLLTAADRLVPVPVQDIRHLYSTACRDLRRLLPVSRTRLERAEQQIANLAREIVDRAEEVEHVRAGPRHRALPDALRLWRTWKAIEAAVAGHLAPNLPP
jgi:hypothetical protein